MYGRTPIRMLAGIGAALLLASGAGGNDELRNVTRGGVVPDYELATMAGGAVRSADSKGKVVVLIYLSAEQRSSERAASDANRVLTDLASEDVELLFVTADWIHRSYFEKRWEEQAIEAPLAFDAERDLYRRLGLIVFPTTVVIDREGRLAHVISTRPGNYPQLINAYVRHALGEIDDDELTKRLKARSFDRGSPRSLASRHRAAARLLREKGLFESAEDELTEALKLDPESVAVRLDLASLHLRMGRTDEARRAVDAVMESEPRHRRAMLLRGVLLLRTNHLDDAEAILKEALVLNPDPARTHFYLGQVFELKGEKDKALTHYREALRRVLDEPVR